MCCVPLIDIVCVAAFDIITAFVGAKGEDADRRMQQTAIKRGIKLTSKSRPLTPEDVKKFDVLVMRQLFIEDDSLSHTESYVVPTLK